MLGIREEGAGPRGSQALRRDPGSYGSGLWSWLCLCVRGYRLVLGALGLDAVGPVSSQGAGFALQGPLLRQDGVSCSSIRDLG